MLVFLYFLFLSSLIFFFASDLSEVEPSNVNTARRILIRKCININFITLLDFISKYIY